MKISWNPRNTKTTVLLGSHVFQLQNLSQSLRRQFYCENDNKTKTTTLTLQRFSCILADTWVLASLYIFIVISASKSLRLIFKLCWVTITVYSLTKQHMYQGSYTEKVFANLISIFLYQALLWQHTTTLQLQQCRKHYSFLQCFLLSSGFQFPVLLTLNSCESIQLVF